jgi:hypothetical protein
MSHLPKFRLFGMMSFKSLGCAVGIPMLLAGCVVPLSCSSTMTPSHIETTVTLRSKTSEMWCCFAGRVVPDVLNDQSASLFKSQAMLLARRIVISSAAHNYGYNTACS